MPKIAFFEVEEWEKEHYKKAFPKEDIFFSKDELTKRNAAKIKDCEILSVFIYSKISKDILENLPNLKLIATRSTGYDHINIEECKKRNIAVCNVPTYGENTVAEHTFALILAISRKIPESIEKTKKGDFRLEGLRGFDLKGKTIGIIGCGNIGQHVARIANGFEMNVLVYDIKQDKELAKELGFNYAKLEDLFRNSDIVTLHLPDNKFTHHMINSKAIRQFKKGAILINTSRGGLIDTSALIKALNNKTISDAGLDVLEGECFIKEEKQLLHIANLSETCDLKNVLQDNILLHKSNVLITPHNAFNSKEALMRILNTTVENIKGFLAKKPVNVAKAQ
jgi:D-lactate dehydrogenase